MQISPGWNGLSSVLNSAQAAILRNVNGGQMVNCLVGVNANGDASWGGTVNGLQVENSSNFNLGGTARNIFAGILSDGISLPEVTNVQLHVNFIGTDRTGNASVPVGLGIFAEKVRNIAIGTSNALSVMGRDVVTRLSAAWDVLRKHRPLVEAKMNLLTCASPKLIPPPENRQAIGGMRI